MTMLSGITAYGLIISAPSSPYMTGSSFPTHMNMLVPADDYPVENSLTAVGATCDVIGSYVRRVHLEVLFKVVGRWPRTGLMDTLGPSLDAPHLQDSRTAVLVQMGAFENHGEHRIEVLLGKGALQQKTK